MPEELAGIPSGHAGAGKFEGWTLRAVRLLLSGQLTNIELKPNPAGALSQRDVVGTNATVTAFWKRVYDQYGTLQVIFECKNYLEVTPEDFRQVLDYTHGEYGRLAFIVRRGVSDQLTLNEQARIKSMFFEHQRLVIVVPANLVVLCIRKMRKTHQYDYTEFTLAKHVDYIVRSVLSLTHEHAFEHVVASILQRQGYWTLPTLKVKLTKEEKRAIGRASSPRWELDVVAYRGSDNSVNVVECKSFLDSSGVDCSAFSGENRAAETKYKLFCDETLRRVVLTALERQLVEEKFVRPGPSVTLCLAAGKIRGDEDWLAKTFERRGWILWGPGYIRDELRALKESGYENSVAAVVTKLLLREPKLKSGCSHVDDAEA
jgi:hypothetical protein